MKKIPLLSILLCFLCLATASAKTDENLQYVNVQEGKTSCDLGVLYKQTPEGMDVEVAGIATAKGADLRRWEISDIKLDVDGEIMRPGSSNNFYSERESMFALPAAVVFAAIGTQYEMYGGSCSSGEVCPVTGQTTGVQPKRGPIASGIDKAGMTAGLGLLTAQAKGDIKGLKCVFKLTKEQVAALKNGKGRIRFILEDTNTSRKQKLSVNIPSILPDFELPYITPTDATPIEYVVFPEKPDVTSDYTTGMVAPDPGTTPPKYFKGQLMTDDDLTAQTSYTKDKMKLKTPVAMTGEKTVNKAATADQDPMLKKYTDSYAKYAKRLGEIPADSEEAKAIRRALPILGREITAMGGEVPKVAPAAPKTPKTPAPKPAAPVPPAPAAPLPSASSYDPATGVTTTSQGNPDGSHTITKTDENGNVISTETTPAPGKGSPSVSTTDPETGETTTMENEKGLRSTTKTDESGKVTSKTYSF